MNKPRVMIARKTAIISLNRVNRLYTDCGAITL